MWNALFKSILEYVWSRCLPWTALDRKRSSLQQTLSLRVGIGKQLLHKYQLFWPTLSFSVNVLRFKLKRLNGRHCECTLDGADTTPKQPFDVITQNPLQRKQQWRCSSEIDFSKFIESKQSRVFLRSRFYSWSKCLSKQGRLLIQSGFTLKNIFK